MLKGFKIVKFEDAEAGLTDYHKFGARPGVFLGFENMRKFYSMRPNSCTDWTGYPQSGKTELLLECLFNTSLFYGWKHLLLVPDIGDYIEVLAILIHKYTGKTFEKKYPNYIEIKEAFNACSWLFEHFHILEKTDPKAKISPVEYWEFACEYKKEHGIQTATIDSWKDLNHGMLGTNYAPYLSNVLPIRNELSEKHNIHFHTVIHPKSPRRNKNGELIHPQVDDMEGGAQWNNSGKTIISVHRASFETKTADVMILKAKPKAIGHRGTFCLMFDPKVSRYYEIDPGDGGRKKYAKRESVPAAQQTILLPQENFFTNNADDLPF